MGTLLITGASGTIGRGLADRWRFDRDILALHHRNHPPAYCGRVQGDVTQPKLGLGREDHAALSSRVTEILHCAALTEFTASREQAERVNVLGTLNVLAFGRDCRKLERIGVLSTAYVAGRRRGLILERELEHRAGFVNVYEQSKYRMEQKLRQAMKGLPIAVYRLSTVAASARNGRVERYHALDRALRLFYNGLVPMLPGWETSAIDLISSDYAVDAIAHLFSRRFQAGKTYHIVAPETDLIPLPEFLNLTADLFARFDRRWKSRVVAQPPIVPLETFRLLERSVERAGNPILRQVVRTTGAFVPQLCYDKRFDSSNMRRGIRGAGIEPRPLRDFYPAFIRHCLRTRWGAEG
ncbi:MAG: SDR family oxidoreductase [Acidobacteriia bacterium]|nr:SDR family oxidoreductase [Terriglobia bacterium]